MAIYHVNSPTDLRASSTLPRVPPTATQPACQPTLATLPHVLATIGSEDSQWTPDGTFPLHQSINILITQTSVLESLKLAMAEDPFFLGNPEHIFLRNSSGSTANRRVVTPSRNSPPPKKWYVVTCGTKVGIFLSWLVHRLLIMQTYTLTDRVTGSMLVAASRGRARRCLRVSSLSWRRTFGFRWPFSKEQSN